MRKIKHFKTTVIAWVITCAGLLIGTITINAPAYGVSEGTLALSSQAPITGAASDCKKEGDLFLRRGEIYQAIHSYKNAVSKDSQLSPAWFNLAIACYKVRDLQGAECALEELVRIVPQDSEAHYNLGCLKLYQGNTSEARKELEIARETSRSEAFLSEQIQKALRFLEIYESSSPSLQQILQQLLRDGLEPRNSA